MSFIALKKIKFTFKINYTDLTYQGKLCIMETRNCIVLVTNRSVGHSPQIRYAKSQYTDNPFFFLMQFRLCRFSWAIS